MRKNNINKTLRYNNCGDGRQGARRIWKTRGEKVERGSSEKMGSRGEMQNANFCLFWHLLANKQTKIHTCSDNVLSFGEIASPFLCHIMGHKI